MTSLTFFNFGESLIKWITNGTSCKILNNGYTSESVPLLRGVKQGCPLSPYLFIIAMEMLAIKVRSDSDVEGLEIGGLQTKMSLYADDASFLLNPKQSCLKKVPYL